MKYNGVGLYTCSANTRASELSVWAIQVSARHVCCKELHITFSPPDKLEMFFQLFFGGITLKMIPSEKGSILSTSSNSAFPPSVIIYEKLSNSAGHV